MRIAVTQAATSTVYAQVARQQDPQQDAAKVMAIREAVGHSIVLRADANRKWSLNQAVAFGHAVRAADLQVLPDLFYVLLSAVDRQAICINRLQVPQGNLSEPQNEVPCMCRLRGMAA